MELGSAYPLEKPLTMEIKGRHLLEGIPRTITIDDSEIRDALSECVATIVSAIRVALETMPPFLMAGARFLAAGAILYLWARWRGAPTASCSSASTCGRMSCTRKREAPRSKARGETSSGSAPSRAPSICRCGCRAVACGARPARPCT